MSAASTTKSAMVVGAGVVGLGCAHYLSKAGLEVTVIDRQTIAGACSHGNCGYVSPSHVLPLTEPAAIPLALKSLLNPHAPFRVKPTLDLALWNWMWQFARRCNERQMIEAGHYLHQLLQSSREKYARLIEEEQLDCEWNQDGLLCVFRSQKALDQFAATGEFIEKHFGMKDEFIPRDELPEFEPALRDDLAGAFRHTQDASLRPDVLCRQWAERLKQSGVQFHESCDLTSVNQASGRLTHLSTSEGEMQADIVVFALGAWSGKLGKQLGCKIPVQPGKGYSVTMSRPTPCPRYPMLLPEERTAVSPFERGYRLGSMMEFAGFDDSIPAHRIEQLRRSAEPYLVAPHTDVVQEQWFGWRPMTYDTVPIIGHVPGLENALLATGHCMLGLSMATGTGKLITELALGEPPHIDPKGYSPDRFQ